MARNMKSLQVIVRPFEHLKAQLHPRSFVVEVAPMKKMSLVTLDIKE